MSHFSLLLILALAMAGCGEKDTLSEAKDIPPKTNDSPSESNAKPKVASMKPEKAPEIAFPVGTLTNTLGMVFKPVPETKVRFCIWETRVKDYATYAEANAGVDGSWKEPAIFKSKGFKQGDTHPVVMVNWEDANAFCAWLTKKELAAGKIKAGQKYRLPTDAEWSVAVGLGYEKGNTPEEKDGRIMDVYPWGKEWPPPKGAGNYYKTLKVDGFEYTAPVGSFVANEQGLHDMGGNVLELCEDKYKPTSTRRVSRGACWNLSLRGPLLSSSRLLNTPGGRLNFTGFRCVLADE